MITYEQAATIAKAVQVIGAVDAQATIVVPLTEHDEKLQECVENIHRRVKSSSLIGQTDARERDVPGQYIWKILRFLRDLGYWAYEDPAASSTEKADIIISWGMEAEEIKRRWQVSGNGLRGPSASDVSLWMAGGLDVKGVP